MNYAEFGSENREVIILLHGGGLSWWNYREAAQILSARYRVILPVLDGHAGSSCGFTSIEDNAAEIIGFIDEHFGGSVLLMGGLSLGGQILLEILSRRKDICRYALIESAAVLPSKAVYHMIKPAFGGCFGLIRRRWFAKLQFRSLHIKEDLFEDYYRDTCGITKENMIAFLQANALYALKDPIEECTAETYIFAGKRENRTVKRSAKIIHGKLRGSTLQFLPGLYHGEFSINRADEYAKKIAGIADNRHPR